MASKMNRYFSQANSPSIILLLVLVGVLGLVVLVLYCQMSLEWLGTYRHTTTLADLDGDGDLDVIVGQTRWENEDTSFAGITLWLNQGGGQFAPGDQELPGGFSAAAGDVDGDGDADLLVLDGYQLTLSLNQGGVQGGKVGVFKTNNPIRPKVWRGHMDMGGSVVLGDLNNDGEVDGFVAGCCYGSSQKPPDNSGHIPSSSWVWINEWDPRGWLVRHTLSLKELDGLPMRAAALGDLDGDGYLDVFAAIGTLTLGGGSSLADRVLLNDGLGNFTDSSQRLGETDSSSVALGDLDGDGDLDALVGTRNGAVVWINQGGAQRGKAGVFASSGQEIAGSQTTAVFLKDLNGDGNLHALIAGVEQADIWWNDGHGTFKRSNQHFRYSNRHGLAVGDFNGDGYADIFAGALAEDYTVWFNQGRGTFQVGNRRFGCRRSPVCSPPPLSTNYSVTTFGVELCHKESLW